MKNTSLFDIIYESFGLNGKSVELVNRRKVEHVETIHSVKRTKDGLHILNHYCSANPGDISAYRILNEVGKFEQRYGDGTSLLTMLLVFLTKEKENVTLKRESIIRDIDTIMSDIDKQIIEEKKELKDEYLERWIKTICKQDKISDSIVKFIKEKPKANLGSFRNLDNPESDQEVVFMPKKGYFINCYANRRYVSSIYNGFKDAIFVLIDGDLTEERFNELEKYAIEARKRMFVLCRAYSDEVDALINESPTINIMALRYASTEESESEIKQDLRFMFDLKDAKAGGESNGVVGEVIVNEDGAFLLGSPKKQSELEEYSIAIKDAFIGDDVARGAMLSRISNILSNNTFDIGINSRTHTRQNVIRDMLEDIFKSLPHYGKGLIKGGMSYIDTKKFNGGKVIQLAREIKEKLVKGTAHQKSNEVIVPIDLLENTKAIYKIVKEYCLELIDTYEEPLMSNRSGR